MRSPKKTLLQLLTYFRDSDEDKPASRFPSIIISQCLFDARFDFQPCVLRNIFASFMELGYNPITDNDYEFILIDNVLHRI